MRHNTCCTHTCGLRQPRNGREIAVFRLVTPSGEDSKLDIDVVIYMVSCFRLVTIARLLATVN